MKVKVTTTMGGEHTYEECRIVVSPFSRLYIHSRETGELVEDMGPGEWVEATVCG